MQFTYWMDRFPGSAAFVYNTVINLPRQCHLNLTLQNSNMYKPILDNIKPSMVVPDHVLYQLAQKNPRCMIAFLLMSAKSGALTISLKLS